MAITLTRQDQRLFGKAVEAILTLDASEPLAWERDVCRRLKALLRADRVGFFGTPEHPDVSFSEDYDDAVTRTYAEYYSFRDPGRQRLLSARKSFFTRAMLFRDGFEPLLQSECYNEFFVPNGVEDSAGLSLPGDRPGAPPQGLLALHRAEFGSDDFTLRAPALLGMLVEPFRQTFLLRQRLRRQLADFHRTVDALPQPAALYETSGRLSHANPALLARLGGGPDAAALRRKLERAARACARTLDVGGGRGDGTPPLVPGVTATLLRSLLPGSGDPLVLVVLPETRAPVPPVAEIRARFGLTRRQAEVARLLARRKTNAEVAAAVSISPHTARRHTEAVLSRLGVTSRREVAAVLVGDTTSGARNPRRRKASRPCD